jgi:translation initiation factor 1
MSDEKPPWNNPFATVLGKLKDLPQGPKPQEAAPSGGADGNASPRPPAAGPARAVVRMERKGRGGKEITTVEQLGLEPRKLESWLKELKAALGCGGAVENGAIVLQGDQRKRLPALLSARGVRRVIVS